MSMNALLLRSLMVFILAVVSSTVEVVSVSEMGKIVQQLVNQIELQQFIDQERVRSEGNSGIKQVRVRHSGTVNYHTETHTGRSVATIHQHSNYIRTVGLGEFSAVLNGVEFKTRHNDYSLVMPSTNSSALHAVEDIPFPPVPPAVLSKTSLADQVKEMREWFKAWVNQDHSKRDYRPYFRPLLCYLEGAWFNIGGNDTIQESFKSSRHFLDANRWSDLHDRARFMAYSGGKSRLENLAVLPTSFMGMMNETTPQLAQWNYRILCHPIKQDIPLKYIHVVEDLSARFFSNRKKTMAELKKSRAARFGLNARASGTRGGQYGYGLLDEIMSQIPGKDNYQGKIFSKANDGDAVLDINGEKPLNQAYYHRWFQMKNRDAMGLNLVHRGFSDEYLFAARTTQSGIAGREYRAKCRWIPNNCKKNPFPGCKPRRKRRKFCPRKTEKWTWAIPLEIIYLTPLHTWNPLNIEMKKNQTVVTEKWKRNGNCAAGNMKAFNGSSEKVYYRTPVEFFVSGKSKNRDKADTVRNRVCVLSKSGEKHETTASGLYIHLPMIEGVGSPRIRYPIMPVHGEGNSMWKELNALRDLVMNSKVLKDYLYAGDKEQAGVDLRLRQGWGKGGPYHSHLVELTADDYATLRSNKKVMVTTDQVNGHTHRLTLKMTKQKKIVYIKCDGKKKCPDQHPRPLIRL